EPGQLDADRFASLAASARADLAAGRPSAAAAGMAAALALWRGPALGDIADLAFAQADVARLEEARRGALQGRIDAAPRFTGPAQPPSRTESRPPCPAGATPAWPASWTG